MNFSTPVLFIIFNRPEHTARVFAAIRAARPRQLFISADGPRPDRPGEHELCLAARDVIKAVDWDCIVATHFSETNRGCKYAVSGAIDWFFTHVSEGIILEDDCLPNPSFFTFCAALLAHWRDDERVMQISGNNFIGAQPDAEASYYFSRLNDVWGWATWRRAWQHYDVNLASFPAFKTENQLANYLLDPAMQRWFLSYAEEAYALRGTPRGIWSTQWQYAIATQNALTAVPAVNLVANIGIGRSATTATTAFSPYAQFSAQELATITHPQFVTPNHAADTTRFKLIAETDPRARAERRLPHFLRRLALR